MATQSTPLDTGEVSIPQHEKPMAACPFIEHPKGCPCQALFTSRKPYPAPRLCTVCSLAIPTARLKAMPSATKCVPCITKDGNDVPLLRRFDEQSAQGTVETLFTRNVNLERQLDRQRQTVPGYRAENAEPSFYEEHLANATQAQDVRGDGDDISLGSDADTDEETEQ